MVLFRLNWKWGSEREFDEVPDWRGFQDFGFPVTVGDLYSPTLSAADCRRALLKSELPQ